MIRIKYESENDEHHYKGKQFTKTWQGCAPDKKAKNFY